MEPVDLTPFGFTPTESAAYGALLAAGPSSGYAVARHLAVARANAYQALNGLVTKQAADCTGEDPQIFRAVQPAALLARISRDTATKLSQLERQVDALDAGGAPDTVWFTGAAEFSTLLMRLVVREPEPVVAVLNTDLLSQTMPVWRTRAANERPTTVWSIGEPPVDFPLPVQQATDPAVDGAGSSVSVVVTATAAMLCHEVAGDVAGCWTSHPLLLAAAHATASAIGR